MTSIDDVAPWLGPAADDMTDEQIGRFITVWDETNNRFPDPDDQPERDEMLSAAVQWTLGDTDLEEAGSRVRRTRQDAALAMVAARQVAVMAVADGSSEVAVARSLGVTRTAVRDWLGKPR